MKRHYGELLLALSERWRVRGFWYDWRKDLQLAAAELEAHIRKWFAADEPVHLVAHCMGGLVARTFIKNYPSRWQAMWDADGNGSRGGRLVMLGTQNHGSYAAPQLITGLDGLVSRLAALDPGRTAHDVLDILNSFPGLYHLLPSPYVSPANEAFFDSKTYGELRVRQSMLTAAAEHHEALADVVDPDRMVCVAGANRPTAIRVLDVAKIASRAGYAYSMSGDGRLAHRLGRLADASGRAVPTYYVDENHGGLPVNDRVLSALPQLLDSGSTALLPRRSPKGRPVRPVECRGLVEESEQAEDDLFHVFVTRLRARGPAAPAHNHPTHYLGSQERAAEEILTGGFLTRAEDDEDSPPHSAEPPFAASRIEIALICGAIEEPPDGVSTSLPPDVVAVGHYIGVRPRRPSAHSIARSRVHCQARRRVRTASWRSSGSAGSSTASAARCSSCPTRARRPARTDGSSPSSAWATRAGSAHRS